jgi:hypothetical protein
MAGIDSISANNRIPLRIVRGGEDRASSTGPGKRAEELTRQLDNRLSAELSQIRSRLASGPVRMKPETDSPGAGKRLDILA